MTRPSSIVAVDEALWRTGLGASTRDLSTNSRVKLMRDKRGNDYIDLAKLDGGAVRIDTSVRVISVGTR